VLSYNREPEVLAPKQFQQHPKFKTKILKAIFIEKIFWFAIEKGFRYKIINKLQEVTNKEKSKGNFSLPSGG